MQKCQSLKRFTTLAVLITISLGFFINATKGAMFPKASDMAKSTVTDGSALSPCAQQIFKSKPEITPRTHLKDSKSGYDKLYAKIQESIKEGNVIHVEDGESDDLWQNILGILRGVVPKKVFLHGGYWKLRKECARIMWKYFQDRFNIKMPEIMTLHANTIGSFTDFDRAEGPMLVKDQIENLRAASLDLNTKEYRDELKKAEESLRKTLKENKFTTIFLKTAPAGLVDILKKFEKKVAIIWTGPVERIPDPSSWLIKYNYLQAPEEGDRLLAMGVPIIITSPWIANARMNAIVDKQSMKKYRNLLPQGSMFVPTDTTFHGFDNLETIQLHENRIFSNYIFALADALQDKMEQMDKNAEKAKDDKLVEISNNLYLNKADRKKEIEAAESNYLYATRLPRRWKELKKGNTIYKIFREFCPVDQAIQVVSDPHLKDSVREVVEVGMKRPNRDPKEKKIHVWPESGTGIFIISQMFTHELERQIQFVIDWMDKGKEEKIDLQTPLELSTLFELRQKWGYPSSAK
ncbi:hypothetical protein PtA15_7A221 [Puccinia triticina]|uniref:Uncharacterized protein n=1 Tax=Puccinia triticina TaxID=208348 RepID=A0ABY7CRU5_9BASI|nr:uncharacterized protein PtA15_7A221 [Puccinia triticina]WAQ86495.1 hypothetical protein PtA15_7A221 [Puccinia triticina]